MLEKLKEHPYIAIGALLAGVAVIVVVRSSGGGGVSTPGSDPNVVAASTALQVAQLQSQDRITSYGIAADSHAGDTAAALEAARLQNTLNYHIADLTSNVTLADIDARERSTATVATLQAQTTQAGITAQTQQRAIDATASTTNYQTLANSLIAQSNNNTAVSMAAIQAQSGGLFSWLFG